MDIAKITTVAAMSAQNITVIGCRPESTVAIAMAARNATT